MALNISSSQIYAGRYHYKRQEIPNLLDTQKYTASTPGKSVKEATGVDTVTISDEGYTLRRLLLCWAGVVYLTLMVWPALLLIYMILYKVYRVCVLLSIYNLMPNVKSAAFILSE